MADADHAAAGLEEEEEELDVPEDLAAAVAAAGNGGGGGSGDDGDADSSGAGLNADDAAQASAQGLPGGAADTPSGGQPVIAKLLISNAAAGSVIGKGGQTIEQIQKNSGARVQLSRAGEFYPGTSERVLLLSGTLHSVLTSVFLMLEKLPKEAPLTAVGGGGGSAAGSLGGAGAGSRGGAPPPSSLGSSKPREDAVKLAVSRKLCGAVIGQRGGTIRDFMADSGAAIRVQPLSELTPSDSERLITVSGGRDKVLRAVALILNTLSADDKFGAYMDLTLQLANTQGLIPAARTSTARSVLANAKAQLLVALHDEDVGAVLGKKGQTLTQIQQNAKVTIKISDRARMDPHTHEREVAIAGTYAGVQLACAMISEKLSANKQLQQQQQQQGGLGGGGGGGTGGGGGGRGGSYPGLLVGGGGGGGGGVGDGGLSAQELAAEALQEASLHEANAAAGGGGGGGYGI